MKRTTAREIAIQLGFSVALTGQDPGEAVDAFFEPAHYAALAEESELYAERPSKKDLAYIRDCVTGVTAHREELDARIGRYARGWRTERISRSAAAVLRQALYEILYRPEIPDGAAISEAVELLKGYEDPEVVAFVNGILGGFFREEVAPKRAETAGPSTEPSEPPPPEDAQDG